MLKVLTRCFWTTMLGFCALAAGPAQGALLINEIYLDPPGGLDVTDEYIEIRGTLPGEAGMSLSGIYFIAVENEDNATHTGNTGRIDSFINLSTATLGSNGYLAIVRPGHSYAIHPDASVLNWTGANLENSGATYWLVDIGGGAAPVNNQDLDLGNDGLDALPAGWTILDSIGVFSEAGEAALGRLYASVNFGPDATAPFTANYQSTGFEIEYLARWGNSTGSTHDDWNVSNLSNDPEFFPQIPGIYFQSAEYDQFGNPIFIESSHSPKYPYGLAVTTTLGTDNYPVPEPSSIILASCSALAFAGYAARRRVGR